MTRALKWRIAIGLLLVFLAGTATGFFAGSWHARSAFKVRHGGMMGDRMRDHITRHLDLTPEQLRVIDPILDRTSAELQAIRAETGQRVSETMKRSQQEMAPHLTPEQQAKAEKMKMRHMRIIKFRGRHHHGPPPREP
jgi:Spy/CpxP family protein refolding chaperone